MVIVGRYRGRVFIQSSLEEFLGASYDELGVTPSLVRTETERLGRSTGA